ncbi:SMI1/KNR4 family protein [Amycolatopsis sp. lyj-109]|uniref:SMI1/KNR4 family protein n=1 Tax=Amycolatopsis sp. lyj-109 TaxID=2789287 RepID=UPI00397AFBC0
MTVAGWREFLLSHSIEFLNSDTLREAEADGRAEWMLTDAQREAGWLGFEPAGEESLLVAERRLGVNLPTTYRNFLSASNGWSSMAGEVDLLAVEQVDWFTKLNPGLLERWSGPVRVLRDSRDVPVREGVLSRRPGPGVRSRPLASRRPRRGTGCAAGVGW